MTDYDAIRGKKPTKTELILNYMVGHPNVVLTPKEVAEGLEFNLRTTVTVLNRLAMEGAISKEARGQFCYHPGENEAIVKDTGVVMDFDSPGLDKKTAELIYKAIYETASASTGPAILNRITGLGQDDFDKKAPIESIKNLVRALIDLVGEEIAGDIVSIALENELNGGRGEDLKQILEP
jgi:hypothetical protein